VTAPGTTVQQTVTTTPATQPHTTTTQPQTTTSEPSPQSGAALNDAGFQKMQAGDYSGALPLLEQAVQKLQGTGSTTEAWADYNLAYTRYKLGNCGGVVDLLNASEAIQGSRKEISRLRRDAERHC
jgi:TolA-binding protein